MKNFSDQIQYGLLALEKGFITPEVLATAVQQWLNDASDQPLGPFLVSSGKLSEEQLQALNAELETTREVPFKNLQRESWKTIRRTLRLHGKRIRRESPPLSQLCETKKGDSRSSRSMRAADLELSS